MSSLAPPTLQIGRRAARRVAYNNIRAMANCANFRQFAAEMQLAGATGNPRPRRLPTPRPPLANPRRRCANPQAPQATRARHRQPVRGACQPRARAELGARLRGQTQFDSLSLWERRAA